MENEGSLGNWVAQGAIALFLLLLVLLVLRTSFMIGSVVMLNFFKRRGKEEVGPPTDPSP
ncbi:MAG: hypothetical protein IBJ03_03105 [Gemmatimonadaceae bacterium]|nr:hypothetical protein [Gemmatimonadaceae bacterium]